MSSASLTTVGVPPTTAAAARGRRRADEPACRHCGAPLIDDRMRETGFCCTGCSYVYRLVHERGLEGYYELRDDITAPADAAVFEPRDYAWLDTAQRSAEAAAKIPELTVDVQGISCAACVWLIQRIFQQQPGARDVFVNAQYGTMRLRWVTGVFSVAEFARTLQSFGYVIGPTGNTPVGSESRALVKRIGLCAAFAMNVMLFSLPAYFGMDRSFEWAALFRLLAVVFGTLSFLVGGMYFVGRAVHALGQRALHIDLPIALGILGAYVGSMYGWLSGEERFVYFDFLASFILLMLVGRWAQTAAVERNRRRLLSQQPKPQRVRLVAGGDVAPEELTADQSILIRPGQTLPVEGRLESEHAVCSLASINGEAEPRTFAAGDRLPAGAVNVGRGEVRVRSVQPWSESLLAQLLAGGQRGHESHPLLERIVRGYIAGILLVAVAAGAGWLIVTQDALRAGAVVTAVLVVSCPCAIGLAFPLADEMATVALRRRGVFVREPDLWPRLSRVRKLVFDKTGTLTLEKPALLNPHALRQLDGPARAALYALVRDNPHPVSECLREELLASGDVHPTPGSVTETVGAGVELGSWSLGVPGWRAGRVAGDVGAEVVDTVLAHDSQVVAEFRFADRPRADAAGELAVLRQRGLDAFILSGDRPEKVRALALELGIPVGHALGAMSPQDKAGWVEQQGARDAMMLGDGANDSLAFDRALCRGTPVIHRGVLERKADFYYLGRGIGGLRALLEVDRTRRQTHRMILVFSVAYNVAAVGLAVAGAMNPLIAAALMPANSLLTLVLVTAGMRPVWRG